MTNVRIHHLIALLWGVGVAACHHASPASDHAGHDMSAPAPLTTSTTTGMSTSAAISLAQGASGTLPAGAVEAKSRLDKSPRHGEWVTISTGPSDSVRAWVVYPERSTKAPVIVVVHEIFGLSTWVRATTDQLASDGYIAIAPDLLTGKAMYANPDSFDVQNAIKQISQLKDTDVQRQLSAVARYGMGLPAALPKYGIVGFCWGGTAVFSHAVHAVDLGAAVVYYGTSPKPLELASVRAPVLGLYGGKDERVNATIPQADSTLQALGKTFSHQIFPGAGHGFLRAQDGQDGANLAATQGAWPATIGWFRKYLGA
ncbi:MAG: dienelactone hydrolase family protein [Gemmatimonadaceae bacterium]